MSKVIHPQDYEQFLHKIKETIRQKQLESFRKVNASLIGLYWEIGQSIVANQKKFDWGKSVVKNLSEDLQKDFPGIKGFPFRIYGTCGTFIFLIFKTKEYFLCLGKLVGHTTLQFWIKSKTHLPENTTCTR